MPSPTPSVALIQRRFPRIVLASLWFGLLSLPLMMELKAPFFGLERPLLVSAGVAVASLLRLAVSQRGGQGAERVQRLVGSIGGAVRHLIEQIDRRVLYVGALASA